MVGIDGDVDEDEIAIVRRLANNEYSQKDLESAFKFYETHNINECIKSIADATNEKQRLAIVANLIDIAMADGVIEKNEELLLEEFAKAFELDFSDFEVMFHVMAIKNDKSIFI